MPQIGSLEIEIRAGVARLQEDFNKAKKETHASMHEIKSTVKEQLDGVKESLKGLKEMAEAAGIMMLGEHLLEAAKSAAEFGDQVEHAAAKTGMSAKSIQELSFAARMSDVSSEELMTSMTRLSRAMLATQQGSAGAASAFKSVGISADEIKSMKIDDVLKKVADKFHETQDGAEKTGVAMQLFGRSGAQLIPLLDKGSGSLEEMKKRASELGIVMSDEAVKQSVEFSDKMKELSARTEATSRNLMGALMPALNKIMGAFVEGSKDGGSLKEVMHAVGQAAVWLTGVIAGLAATFEALGKTFGMVAAIISHPMSAKSIFQAYQQDIDGMQVKLDKFVASLNAAPTSEGQASEEGVGSGKMQIYKTSGAGSKKHADKSKMSQYDQALTDEKVYYQQSNDLRQFSKQQELQYWQDILTADNVSANDRLSIQRKISQLRLDQMKNDASDRQKMSEESITRAQQTALNEVDLDKQKAQTLQATGQITADQLLKIQQAYEEEKYQIQLVAQQKRIQLSQQDPNHDPIQLQKQLDQLAQMQQKHATDVEKIQTQAAQASAKAWQDSFKPISQAFDTTVQGMIMGTTTMQKAFANIGQSIVGEFVSMGAKNVANWAANELAKTAATETGTAMRLGIEQVASVQGLASSAISVVKWIMNDAAKAFSGVFSALAGIPFVGPALAAVAAPAAMATVAGVAGRVASSAGGDWQIPSDRLNFVHKNETILPADKSAGLDKLINSGGGGPIHIHGSESSTFSQSQLRDMLKRMGREFQHVRP